jgi:hypothetical protein
MSYRSRKARTIDQPHDKANENNDADNSPPACKRAPPMRRSPAWQRSVLQGLLVIGQIIASHQVRPPLQVEDGDSERACQCERLGMFGRVLLSAVCILLRDGRCFARGDLMAWYEASGCAPRDCRRFIPRWSAGTELRHGNLATPGALNENALALSNKLAVVGSKEVLEAKILIRTSQ